MADQIVIVKLSCVVELGQAGNVLLEELLQQLGVVDIPVEPFSDKGYILYQDAYLMRLNNAGQPALEQFKESAIADEAWAAAEGSPVHRGKAAMSRIAAAAYRTDIAVFAATAPGNLHPNRAALEEVSVTLRKALTTLDKLLDSEVSEDDRRRLEGFRKNALLHLAEAAGWLGCETTVNYYLGTFEPDAELDDSTRRAIGLARGALGLTKGRYEQVIVQLERQPGERVELGTGEGAGKTGVMLLVSCRKLDRPTDAEAMRCWLLNDQCPVDAGNGLAKTWATKLAPIHGER